LSILSVFIHDNDRFSIKKKRTSKTIQYSFFPEKYFAIYFPHRTAFFSHMTARPVDPDSRREETSANSGCPGARDGSGGAGGGVQH